MTLRIEPIASDFDLPVYPLHDRDGFIEFATSMWLHTAPIVGKPTVREVEFTLREIPPTRRLEVVALLYRRGQIA